MKGSYFFKHPNKQRPEMIERLGDKLHRVDIGHSINWLSLGTITRYPLLIPIDVTGGGGFNNHSVESRNIF